MSVAASPTPSAAPSAASAPVSEKPSAPASTASSAPKATATPAPDYTTVGTKAGTRYATAAVNVRSGPSTSFKAITTLVEDDSVTITDRRADGWRQVVIGKTSGWIKESLLTETKPAEPVAQAAGASTSKETAVPDASAACPNAGSLEQNLTARTVTVLRAVCAQFPAVKSYGGYRAGDSGNHGAGKAIDVMISGEAGWEIAKWARANASALGISEVIYEQKIWTTQRSGEGWRAMSDRGSATANHYDHVHLSVR